MIFAVFTFVHSYESATSSSYINIPDSNEYHDQSALAVKSNLESKQYQDFIHTLYRLDKDNLKRVDNLFANADQAYQSTVQPTYATYLQSTAGSIPDYSDFQYNNRRKRAVTNIPDSNMFNDQSALDVKANLESKPYQDFIHTLYRLDKDNLNRVDNLFARPNQAYQSNVQPTYATYLQSTAGSASTYNNNNFQLNRQKRDIIFRPLFVYREFAERARQREEDRIRRRNFDRRHSLASPYQLNEFDQ